jgi:hypothetical protein
MTQEPKGYKGTVPILELKKKQELNSYTTCLSKEIGKGATTAGDKHPLYRSICMLCSLHIKISGLLKYVSLCWNNLKIDLI